MNFIDHILRSLDQQKDFFVVKTVATPTVHLDQNLKFVLNWDGWYVKARCG